MSGLTEAALPTLSRRQSVRQVLAEISFLSSKKRGFEQFEYFRCSRKIFQFAKGLIQRQKRFEQMHVRILTSKSTCYRTAVVKSAVLCGETLFHKCNSPIHNIRYLRVRRDPIVPGEAEQHESMRVG